MAHEAMKLRRLACIAKRLLVSYRALAHGSPGPRRGLGEGSRARKRRLVAWFDNPRLPAKVTRQLGFRRVVDLQTSATLARHSF